MIDSAKRRRLKTDQDRSGCNYIWRTSHACTQSIGQRLRTSAAALSGSPAQPGPQTPAAAAGGAAAQPGEGLPAAAAAAQQGSSQSADGAAAQPAGGPAAQPQTQLHMMQSWAAVPGEAKALGLAGAELQHGSTCIKTIYRV